MPEKLYPHSYKLIITDLSGGLEKAFEIYVPAFDAIVFGDTVEKALEGYFGYFDSEVKRRKKEKIPMPKPDFLPDVIRQIPLRIPTSIYQKILKAAKKKKQSFNRYVTELLENY